MATTYVVTGLIGRRDVVENRRSIVYAGQSAERAFKSLDAFTKECQLVLEIWENDKMLKKIYQGAI